MAGEGTATDVRNTLGAVRVPPLIPIRLRRIAVVVAVLGWLATLGMDTWYAWHPAAGPLDDTLTRTVHALAPFDSVSAQVLVAPTTAALVYAVIAALAVFALLRKRWELAALAVLGPGLCVLLTELVFKPLVGRVYAGYLSFPSGHTVSSVSAYLLAALVLVAGRPIGIKVVGLVLFLALSACLTAGLVAMNYHYPSDTVGGFFLVLGIMLPGAVGVDVLTGRRLAARSSAPPLPQAG